jgi:hypothetical protein
MLFLTHVTGILLVKKGRYQAIRGILGFLGYLYELYKDDLRGCRYIIYYPLSLARPHIG